MKNPLKISMLRILAIAFLLVGFSPSGMYASDGVEYESQGPDENISPENTEDDIGPEGEEEYILVDEEGNVIDEDTLFGETNEESEEVPDSEDGHYIDQNVEDEDVIFIEEGEVTEEGEPIEGESELEADESYEHETEGQENEEEKSPVNDR